MATPNYEFYAPQKLPVSALTFDKNNPRFAIAREEREDPNSEIEIIKYLADNSDVGELLQSISSNGYIDIEPLVVVPDDHSDYFKVVEGNRRLAALKLLLYPNLADKMNVSIPQLSDAQIKKLELVTVYPVKNYVEARPFIGFKHVNGPHTWDSFAKARFAADWYANEKDNGITLNDIATNLGDRHDTVRRMVEAIYILDQAENEGVYSLNDRYPGRQFAFSHLYTALTYPEFRRYIGLPISKRKNTPTADAIHEENFEHLHRLLVWLYGSESEDLRPIVRSQNPDLKNLRQVLGKPVARNTLEQTGELNSALEDVNVGKETLEKSLVRAHNALAKAKKNLTSFDGSDKSLLQVAESVHDDARFIKRAMRDQVESSDSAGEEN